MTETIGLLVMAYGTASGPEDIERYYTDIRGGRAPSSEALEDLKARYAAIGNRFPLGEITRAQAEGLEERLNAAGGDARFRAYVGYKHAAPFVADVVREMAADGIRRAVGIVMAPHYSRMSIGSYVERVERARPLDLDVDVIESWHDQPAFLEVLVSRVASALEAIPPEERDRALVVFTAHSLPTRILEWEDPYPDQLRATAEAVGARLGLANVTTAWQSAGRTDEPWLGPSLKNVIDGAAREGHPAVLVCPCGFAADHLEILYDVDIEAAARAERAGIRLIRTESMNATPEFVRALAEIVRSHLGARRNG